MVPDLGQTNGRVEAEVDEEGDTQMEHDVPWQYSIELQMKRHNHGLLDLKHADNPERQVADQQKGDNSAAWFALHLSVIIRSTAEPIQDENCL